MIDPATLQSLTDAHVAILGKTGSGKSYAAKGIVEGLLADGLATCIIDPTGVWWGLRSLADGSDSGLPVVVLGGPHGDAPLPPDSGALVARLVIDRRINVVVDTSELGGGATCRWFTAFAEELFRLSTRPLRLVIDEAHLFAPQGRMVDPQAGQMLHAANKLATGGRSRGLRLMLLTQRPAQLHKNTLTQIDSLIAMRVTSPHDREAVEEWIKGAGDREKAKEVLDSLAKMKRGEGWVWAPELDVLTRTTFPAIRTFDSSAAPRDGEERIAPRPVTPAGIAEIAAMLASEPVEVDGKLAKAAGRVMVHVAADLEKAREAGRAEERARLGDELEPLIDALHANLESLNSFRGSLIGSRVVAVEGSTLTVKGPEPKKITAEVHAAPVSHHVTSHAKGGAHLRILRVLANSHPARVTVAQWATLSGMKRTGGTWHTYVSRLRVLGFIAQEGALFTATKEGMKAVGVTVRRPQSKAEVIAGWKDSLGSGPSKILDVLLAAHPRRLDRLTIAGRLGMEASGGTFQTYLSRLVSNELVEKHGAGYGVAAILTEEVR